MWSKLWAVRQSEEENQQMCLNCIDLSHIEPFLPLLKIFIIFLCVFFYSNCFLSLPQCWWLLFSPAQKSKRKLQKLIIHLTIFPMEKPQWMQKVKDSIYLHFLLLSIDTNLFLCRLHGLSWHLHELNTQTHYKISFTKKMSSSSFVGI